MDILTFIVLTFTGGNQVQRLLNGYVWRVIIELLRPLSPFCPKGLTAIARCPGIRNRRGARRARRWTQSRHSLDIVVVFERLPNAYREAFVYEGWPVEAFSSSTASGETRR
jgi:hypothetical protein